MNIAAVEDNPVDLTVFRQALVGYGHEVREQADGDQAWAALTCCGARKIRHDQNYRQPIATFVRDSTGRKFTHSFSPVCHHTPGVPRSRDLRKPSPDPLRP
jgi:hypothetical protein